MVGLYLTAGSTTLTSSSKGTSSSTGEALSINTRYMDTARRLVLMAATPEEQHAATSALDAADRELDLEYAYDLQLAANEPFSETLGIQAVQERIGRIKKAIKRHQAEVDQLKSAMNRVVRSRQAALEEQLDVSEAELSLSKEALGDVKDELVRAGGDPQGRLEKLKAEHESASKEHDTFKFSPLPLPAPSGSLLGKLSRWKTIRHVQSQILQARQQAVAAAADLTHQHETLKKRIATEEG
jgi:hypothetical protein